MFDRVCNYSDIYMNMALAIARNNLGNTMPNPSVGCILVNQERVVGKGGTALGGRPHAEHFAINQAGELAKGATVYLTLEPCSHYGCTPPCVDLLIKSGIKKAVIAIKDPDSRVNGNGIAKLKDAGIKVEYGIGFEEAKFLNAGHFYNRIYNRPYVTLKLATTLDGKIASFSLDSKWITGPLARKVAHKIRSINDAILIGKNTLIKDNPMLNCRLPGLENTSPIKIVLSNNDTLTRDLKIFQSGETWVIGGKCSIADGKNIKNIILENSSVNNVLSELAIRGITRLMIEGGTSVVTQFISHGLVDQLIWFRAPKIGGNDAQPAVGAMHFAEINDFLSLHRVGLYALENDMMEVFIKHKDDFII